MRCSFPAPADVPLVIVQGHSVRIRSQLSSFTGSTLRSGIARPDECHGARACRTRWCGSFGRRCLGGAQATTSAAMRKLSVKAWLAGYIHIAHCSIGDGVCPAAGFRLRLALASSAITCATRVTIEVTPRSKSLARSRRTASLPISAAFALVKMLSKQVSPLRCDASPRLCVEPVSRNYSCPLQSSRSQGHRQPNPTRCRYGEIRLSITHKFDSYDDAQLNIS